MNCHDSNDLCLECGLCCNGVLFADVQLGANDDPARLRSLGLQVASPKSEIGIPKLKQPCTAFDGCRCRVYADRPGYCRQFECLLLKKVKAGQVETAAALRTIRSARKRVENVKRLLGNLGDTEEHLALSKRFRRVKHRLEQGTVDRETASVFGELTLAVHELNVLLSEAFYR